MNHLPPPAHAQAHPAHAQAQAHAHPPPLYERDPPPREPVELVVLSTGRVAFTILSAKEEKFLTIVLLVFSIPRTIESENA